MHNLNAEQIEDFMQKHKEELMQKSGLTEDELETLSKREFNELLDVIYHKKTITIKNTKFYYIKMYNPTTKTFDMVMGLSILSLLETLKAYIAIYILGK